jgi:hypothetical protein
MLAVQLTFQQGFLGFVKGSGGIALDLELPAYVRHLRPNVRFEPGML